MISNTCAAIGSLLSLALSGCSLAGFDSFELPACRSDSDCDALNRRTGTALDACNRFVCSTLMRKCERRSMRVEICDGVDNDCNGLVDENVISFPRDGVTTLAAGSFGAVGFTSTGVGAVGLATNSGGGAATFISVGEDGQPLPGRAVAPNTAIVGMGNVQSNWPNWTPTLDRCSSENNSVAIRCSAIEAAIAPGRTPSEWFVLAVDPLQCTQGRLRAGLLDSSMMPALLEMRGPLAASNIVDGIDIADGPMQDRCTGRNRAARGAARPVLSLARANGYDPSIAAAALGVWIGAPQNWPRCGVNATAEAVNVEALGFSTAYFQSITNATARPIVATNAPMGVAIPAVLGQTRGGGSPAVVPLPSGGWVVAFANATGDVTVRTVARIAPTQPFLPSEMQQVPRSTPDLVLGPPFTVGRAGSVGPADHVALGVRTIEGRASPVIAVTWVEGCGAESSEVYLAQLELNNDSFTEQRRGPVARAAVGALMTSVIGLDGGLIDRGHRLYSSGDVGGWLVTFVASGSLRGARVLGADLSLIDSPPAILVETGVASQDQRPLSFSTNRAAAAIAWFDTVERAVKSAPVCGTTRAPMQ